MVRCYFNGVANFVVAVPGIVMGVYDFAFARRHLVGLGDEGVVISRVYAISFDFYGVFRFEERLLRADACQIYFCDLREIYLRQILSGEDC